MVVTVLVENTSSGALRCAHGLSLHVRTGDRSILFDFGPDGELLAENAGKLGVDPAAVDTAVLSHGHNDHAGGLEAFFNLNSHAPVYAHKLAFGKHSAQRPYGRKDIGADPSLPEKYPGRFRLTEGTVSVGGGAILFYDVAGTALVSASNGTLYEGEGVGLQPDRFLHEQNLLLEAEGKLILIAGCAHRGIVNILRRAEEIKGRAPDAVFSGFHLTNPGLGTDEPEAFVRAVGEALRAFPSVYYTGHCTGEGPFLLLRETLGPRLIPLSCGARFEI